MTTINSEEKTLPNGWQFTIELDDASGLILRNVRHDGYFLARDIRVVAMFAAHDTSPQRGSAWQLSPLGSTGFKPVGSIEHGVVDSKLIAPYSATDGFWTEFEMGEGVFGPGSQRLEVRQTYLFTDYSNSPSHEPSALVAAARLYPLLTFRYAGEPDDTLPLLYLRVDYRLDISVDGQTSVLGPRAASSNHPLNQAAVFRDRDSPIHVPTQGQTFLAAEKPLKYEIIGNGMKRGAASDWDNIHQWGFSPNDSLAPPAPGTPHAAHEHWRWNMTFGQPSPTLATPETGPQFTRPGSRRGIGGLTIIDPRIPDQNLTFAIVGYGTRTTGPLPDSWKAGSHEAGTEFEDLFTRRGQHSANKLQPAQLDKGANIVRWMSWETWRSDPRDQYPPQPMTWEGTFCPHGLFFAHNVDAGKVLHVDLFAALGLRADIQNPPPARVWHRP